MSAPADARLWHHVRRTVTPLGQPCRGERPLDLVPARRPGIDLHGETIQDAYDRVREAIDQARRTGTRELVVVTGRSGDIRVEFLTWAALNPDVASFEPMRGGGAYRVRVASPVRGRAHA